ncbi:MAG: CinA family nicotinamide mononucleotide deamidase-related protein [Chitinophagaceae bacterium]
MSNKVPKTVSIITIGDELLIGQTIDTNSAWMAQVLNKAGFSINRRVAIGDQWDQIWNALEEEEEKNDIILITGGLGPTSDDITKPLLCSYFDGKLIVDEKAKENVIEIFTKKLNRPLLDRNLKQAEVPDVCTVIQNQRGTAPGMWFEKAGKIFVSMPGVPFEMKGMMEDYVIPELLERFDISPIEHRTLLTAGIGESFLAEMLNDFESSLIKGIKLAYLPNYGMVRLRLSAVEIFKDNQELDNSFNKLKNIVKDYLVVDKDISLQEAIAEQLKITNKTLALAESCTGGYISHLITLIPGSSSFFLGGVVSYSNDLKSGLLGVPQDILNEFGAVSLETVKKMAEGARQKTGADYGLSVSGIMGPTGETPDKPLGFVCVGFSSADTTEATSFQFRFDRKRNIELTAVYALNFLRKSIG